MMETLIVDKQPYCVTITFNRPEKHNAFNEIFIQELTQTLQTIENDESIRVVIIKANGPSFCAGADLKWMQKMIHFTEKENLHDAEQLAFLLQCLYSLSKPTLVVVNGPAYGGGIGIMACCDIVLAASNACFCFSEVKMGLIPAVISPYIIKAMGQRMAKRYFFTAEQFSAKEAEQYGLVHEIVPATSLSSTADRIARQIIHNGPQAVASIKSLVHQIDPLDEAVLKKTSLAIASIRVSAEGQEGLNAFLQKRSPAWIKE